ncbi:hypothetical protein TanjilG_28289 [Lupinus angustifolius]|uniref:RING-type E3 ubiquitin transferase n=1 Tax=Lupinus angustifolius TaxID=3871 RepID=A0A4P1RHU1_LUPAN|nr:PREDICTED: probable E3 ubiquitin-protein ligase LOG2 [Lupinus angustifolius]OIW11198.1 hypothetical protein TanjilG_28289 [Lupinus angustifolius]
MGNITTTNGGSHRRRISNATRRSSHPLPPPPLTPHPEITAHQFLYPGPSQSQYPHPNPNAPIHYPQPQYHYPGGYYPPPPPPMPHHNPLHYPYPVMAPPAPYVEHQRAVTIRNDVNIKKETLQIEPDDENCGRFLVNFTFDATVSGSITIYFFAKEGEGCNLTPMKENHIAPVTVHFEKGLGQKFRQPAGTGIDFSMFEESELLKVADLDVYPLAVKADASSSNHDESNETPTPGNSNTNSQITQALFVKDKGEFRVKVIKQILSVNGMRYELQEIYGIGNSMESDMDENEQGKECVICLSEPRDTIVHPCRHMCMCSGCAKVLRLQTNRCPICRQPIERLLEIKVGSEE